MTKENEKLLKDVFLQPWFVGNETARQIRRLIPQLTFRKLRYYFDDWGCISCHKKGLAYGTNGMCPKCIDRIQARLFWALQKRHVGKENGKPDNFDRVELARALLKDVTPANTRKSHARSSI